MKRTMDVHTEEIMAGNKETVLHSDANRACMVFCAYDAVSKIGGLAHAMFLSGEAGKKKHKSSCVREADKAIDEMLSDMMMLGSRKENIEVCLVTGENIPHYENDPSYKKTLESALDILKEKQVRYKQDSVDDIGNKHVCFDVETGGVSYM